MDTEGKGLSVNFTVDLDWIPAWDRDLSWIHFCERDSFVVKALNRK